MYLNTGYIPGDSVRQRRCNLFGLVVTISQLCGAASTKDRPRVTTMDRDRWEHLTDIINSNTYYNMIKTQAILGTSTIKIKCLISKSK